MGRNNYFNFGEKYPPGTSLFQPNIKYSGNFRPNVGCDISRTKRSFAYLIKEVARIIM